MSKLSEIRKELSELFDRCSCMYNSECQEYIPRLLLICSDYGCEEATSSICELDFIAERVSSELERYGADAIFTVKNLLQDVTDREAVYFIEEGDGNFSNLTKYDLQSILGDILDNYLPTDEDDEDDSEVEDFPS